MGLKQYGAKRDFSKTPEPSPAKASATTGGNEFVVHKHAASHLHYDLRLRVGNVLRCWAVPKGPSFDPREKRLAVETEDHPVEYAAFEGIIPKGEYGGGTMMVWDRGQWSAEDDAVRSLREGLLKFRLAGQRMRGRWMLARTRTGERQPHWILVKERDSEANPGLHAEVFTTSAASGRTMEEITSGAAPLPLADDNKRVPSARDLPGARPAEMPTELKAQLATAALAAPSGDGWFHEVKLDGYRFLIMKKGESIRVLTRRGLDWTAKLSAVRDVVRERVHVDAILDGEAVVLDRAGVSSFQALQNAIHTSRSKSIVFLVFDLPWCDGHDLRKCTLESRKALLRQLIGDSQEGRLRLSQHVEGHGPEALAHAQTHGLEGIVSKKRTAVYSSSRDSSWLKIKCFNQQEFVLGGFSQAEGSREQFGALLLGYYDKPNGSLMYAGRVGTGFSTETLKKLGSLLRQHVRTKPPFPRPPTGAEARGVTWIDPKLVAQVQFRDWSDDAHIRHASFRGLREDIDPASIVREPIAVAEAPVPTTDSKRSTSVPKQSSKRTATTPITSHVKLSNPDRVVFPDRGAGYSVTKAALAAYYETVADRMLPHVARRPLSVLRCPSGEGKVSFFQKHIAKGMPSGVKSVAVSGDSERHLMIKDIAGLLGLVQMNAIEFHPWGSTTPKIERPDRLVFDLDPGEGVAWKEVRDAAGMVREALLQLKLHPFLRTTGGKGLHVVVAITPRYSWDQARSFSKAIVETLARVAPRRFVTTQAKSARAGRIYLDYLRNGRGSTAIASYSVRARPGAPVALPITWDELQYLNEAPDFNVVSVPIRLASERRDPWEGLEQSSKGLPI